MHPPRARWRRVLYGSNAAADVLRLPTSMLCRSPQLRDSMERMGCGCVRACIHGWMDNILEIPPIIQIASCVLFPSTHRFATYLSASLRIRLFCSRARRLAY